MEARKEKEEQEELWELSDRERLLDLRFLPGHAGMNYKVKTKKSLTSSSK